MGLQLLAPMGFIAEYIAGCMKKPQARPTLHQTVDDLLSLFELVYQRGDYKFLVRTKTIANMRGAGRRSRYARWTNRSDDGRVPDRHQRTCRWKIPAADAAVWY